ncbi:MAG: hypothetical protein KIS96_03645 [Bauldia sp.]|nr:hypothetical protein [Bauldia sp.]
MTDRQRLPARRGALNFEVEHNLRRYTVALGFHDDGRLGEIFVTSTKAGSDSQIVANEAAVLASLLLQFGGDIEGMADAMPRNEDGSPQGIMGAVLDAALLIIPEETETSVPA